jgi:hypothetical protein
MYWNMIFKVYTCYEIFISLTSFCIVTCFSVTRYSQHSVVQTPDDHNEIKTPSAGWYCLYSYKKTWLSLVVRLYEDKSCVTKICDSVWLFYRYVDQGLGTALKKLLLTQVHGCSGCDLPACTWRHMRVSIIFKQHTWSDQIVSGMTTGWHYCQYVWIE